MTIDRTSQSERPDGRPAGFQRWLNLLFLHWEVDAAALQATLPEGLHVDTFDGRAYVGVVPFTMRDVSPWWAPPVPGVSHFHELNVRTYVLHRGRPGVWFYSLDAAGTIAVLAARLGWKLPYFRASMQLDIDGDDIRYASRRLWPGPKPATFQASYSVGDALPFPEPGSFEHFLVERYLLFAEVKKNVLHTGQVHHRRYPLREVTLHEWDESVIAAAGLQRADEQPLVHYSQGVDVDVYALHPSVDR